MEAADEISGIQPALGMGNDVHLLLPVLPKDLKNFFPEDPGVFLHSPPGLLVAVKDPGSVFLQRPGDPPPIVKIMKILEAHAMDQQQRIFCAAHILFRPHIVQADPVKDMVRLLLCQTAHIESQAII